MSILNFKAKRIINFRFDQIVQGLPGTHKIRINSNNRQPRYLIEELKTLVEPDTVILEQGDVWAYSEHPGLIQYFQSRPQQNFFILHIGYSNKKICTNGYELAANIFLPMIITKFETKSNPVKPYGCLNRNPKFHRTLLGFKLWQNNLLKNVVYTLKEPNTYTDFLLEKIQQEPGWEEFKQLPPIRWLDDDGVFNDHSVWHPAYSTFCNIVTESETEFFYPNGSLTAPVITEKSYKPFLSCQIPLYLSAQGHLGYLKQLGFDVFEDILPAGYDNMNTFEKVDAIVDLVANCPIDEIYKNNMDRIQHNHKLATDPNLYQTVVDRALAFVKNN